MHKEAYEWLSHYDWIIVKKGLDLGGYDTNGYCARYIWQMDVDWTVVDKRESIPNDRLNYIKADIRDPSWWNDHTGKYDLVLCTEVLEHIVSWQPVLLVANEMLSERGSFFVTCAGPGRKPHNQLDGGSLAPDEYYENILPHQLGLALRATGFKAKIFYDPHVGDVYAYAIKV